MASPSACSFIIPEAVAALPLALALTNVERLLDALSHHKTAFMN